MCLVPKLLLLNATVGISKLHGKGPSSKYFRVCWWEGLHRKNTVLGEVVNSQCGCSNKAVFAKTGNRPDWGCRLQLAGPCLTLYFKLDFLKKFPYILSIISGALDPNCILWGSLFFFLLHLFNKYVTDYSVRNIYESLNFRLVLLSCHLSQCCITHPFLLANISKFLLFAQWSQSLDFEKSFLLLSRKTHFELKARGDLLLLQSPLSPFLRSLLRLCIISGLGTCDGFSRRKLWWKCQLSKQRQLSECSCRNPKYSLLSSCWVFSSSIVRGHCHLVEKYWGG